MSVFTPTIPALNYPNSTAIQLRLISVPPDACARAFSMVLVCIAMHRDMHCATSLVGAPLTITGYGTWLATNAIFIKTRYARLFLRWLHQCELFVEATLYAGPRVDYIQCVERQRPRTYRGYYLGRGWFREYRWLLDALKALPH
ncbi:hypothetical protein B0H11DRAFT_1959960 [Mycena galericulata]|nr:hypothetical protein B0H11DRAFT_1959960 [Mycena galericulata]